MSDEHDDWLLDAARALRDETHGRSPDGPRTRARVLASAHRARTRPTWVMAAAAALVLALFIPLAHAWTRGRLARWRTPEALPAPVPVRVDPPAREDRPARNTPSLPPSPAPAPPVRVEAPAPVALPTTVPSPRSPVDPAERRTYREAHALHFDARDPARALDAWERYLRAYPGGRFAVEARYNRALCLVRLDRRDDARAALRPFADGSHGAYREREARALLEALGP